MFVFCNKKIIDFVKDNSYLVKDEKNEYLAMLEIIKSIPVLAEEYNECNDDEREDTKTLIKIMLTDFSYLLDDYKEEDLASDSWEKYSNLVYGCNIFRKENFYIFSNSVCELAMDMRSEDGRDYASIDEAIGVLLNNFISEIESVNSREDLEELINVWGETRD